MGRIYMKAASAQLEALQYERLSDFQKTLRTFGEIANAVGRALRPMIETLQSIADSPTIQQAVEARQKQRQEIDQFWREINDSIK